MDYFYSRFLNKTVYEVTYKTTDLFGSDVDVPGIIIMQWGEYDEIRNITKNSFVYKQAGNPTGRQTTKFRKMVPDEYQYVEIIDLIPINLNQFLLNKKINAQDNTQINLIIMTDYTNGLLTDNK